MGNIRNVNVWITTNNDVEFDPEDIISVDIKRSITDGAFGIGYTQADRLLFTAVSSEKLPNKTRVIVNVSIDGEESRRLGRFYVTNCVRDGSAITVTAYDAMSLQDKKLVKFGGYAPRELPALNFPCLMQDMLDYIVTYRNLTCEFQCQPFTVQTKPIKPDGSYYTVREILGFIASSHGANAKFDNSGKLTFQPFSASFAQITAADAVDFTIDDSEPFEVTGLLFSIDNENKVYIDDVPGSEFDEDADGVVKCYNPLVTVDENGDSDIANYAWTRIGGTSYYSGSITQRGTGLNNCGDVITVGNLKYPSDAEEYDICITELSYSITAESGFMETLISQADKSDNNSSNSVRSVPKAYGRSTDPAQDTTVTVRIGDLWAKTESDSSDVNVIQELYQREIDDETNEEKWTPIGLVGSSGGVGLNVGRHNEIFNFYDGNYANNITDGDGNHCVGMDNTITNSYYCSAFGDGNEISPYTSGQYTFSAYDCFVTGHNNKIYGSFYNFAGGDGNTITNTSNRTFVYGEDNTANHCNKTAIIGKSNSVVGEFSLIAGELIDGSNGSIKHSIVSGYHQNVKGSLYYSEVGGTYHEIGANSGDMTAYSGIFGQENTVKNADSCLIFGRQNTVTSARECLIGGNHATVNSTSYCMVIGGGSGNVFTLTKSGDVHAAGSISPGGADYAEYFEWLDGNPENEDRRGILVALDGDKIVPATGSGFFGIVSSAPSIVGNSAELFWNGKYQKDTFGCILKNDSDEPVVSDEFDPDKKYVPRSQRPEWAAVGLVGRLIVTDDGKCKPNDYISARDGIAVSSNTRTAARVLRRLDDTHIEVLIK